MTDNATPTTPNRIFKIGATQIPESDATRGKSAEEVRQQLKSAFPEVTHATIRETMLDDGTLVLHYLPVGGRKG
jgi:hypothetical protein